MAAGGRSVPIRAVVFDVGGVLETTPTTGWQARWEARLGLESGEIDARLHDVYRAGSIGAVTLAEAEVQISARLGLDPEQLASVMDELWSEYLGTLNVPLHDWFRACRPRYKTGILSNSWVGAREREHARYAFGDLCDTVVYSHEEGIEKPDPRFYAIVCERLGVQPEEVVFLDDVRVNITAARALGMHGVLFTGDTPETLAELAALLERSTVHDV
ncbi:MAG: HAD family phosphatase [Labilithrix sp.]|nr:HAD family phosphatase [Labilithrix sp.]